MYIVATLLSLCKLHKHQRTLSDLFYGLVESLIMGHLAEESLCLDKDQPRNKTKIMIHFAIKRTTEYQCVQCKYGSFMTQKRNGPYKSTTSAKLKNQINERSWFWCRKVHLAKSSPIVYWTLHWQTIEPCLDRSISLEW